VSAKESSTVVLVEHASRDIFRSANKQFFVYQGNEYLLIQSNPMQKKNISDHQCLNNTTRFRVELLSATGAEHMERTA
jgi:hypothetical protein